jgi:hypothetical protein
MYFFSPSCPAWYLLCFHHSPKDDCEHSDSQ